MNIINAIRELSTKRKIFVSEADFQFALAWEIQKYMPNAQIRLEYCPVNIDASMHIDIIVKFDNKVYPIELKYLTAIFDAEVENEKYILKNQSAQDERRYDFLKDICRLEKLAGTLNEFEKGYAILLTNDSNYWKKPVSLSTNDAAFRINEGAIKSGELKWTENTGSGTLLNREKSINLSVAYSMNWQKYSEINNSRNGEFRFLCIEVNKLQKSQGDFWIYENWVAEKKAVIHRGDCCFCNNGKGNQQNKLGNKNGKWHGQFKNYDEARKFAQNLQDRDVRNCGHCMPQIIK